MSFLVYFAVLLVAAASALFGLDLLTSPLPPEKPKAQVASVAPAANKLARREAERDAADKPANDSALSPVYPARPGQELEKAASKDAPANKDVRVVYAPTNEPVASARAETTGSGKTEPEAPPPQAQPQAAQQAQPQQALLTAPAQQPPQQFTPAAPAQAAPPTAATPVSQQSAPRCDVQACAAAYRSFSAADCTYQPLAGARRICDKAPGHERNADNARPKPEARPQRVARQPDDDGRMSDVVRRVKELTAARNDDADVLDTPFGRRRVIMIERGREDFWR